MWLPPRLAYPRGHERLSASLFSFRVPDGLFCSGRALTGQLSRGPIGADVAALCLIAAALGLFKIWVPPEWWRPLVLLGAGVSALLFLMYAGSLALLPLAVAIVLLWGVLSQGWTISSLAGSDTIW
jgi:hypothetical protein